MIIRFWKEISEIKFKLRHDTARQLRICDEQFWDLRVPTDGGDTEFPDA
jgi:hypothetical protein